MSYWPLLMKTSRVDCLECDHMFSRRLCLLARFCMLCVVLTLELNSLRGCFCAWCVSNGEKMHFAFWIVVMRREALRT